MDYIAYLHKDADSDFGVSFPDFQGCVTAGRTLEEARQLAGEALALHVGGMKEDGLTVPQPSTLDQLANDPALKTAVAFLVTAAPAVDEPVRVNIAARRSQIAQIDARAKRMGLSRSAYLIQAGLHTFESASSSRRTAGKQRA